MPLLLEAKKRGFKTLIYIPYAFGDRYIMADSLLEKSKEQKLAGIAPELKGRVSKTTYVSTTSGGHGRGFLGG